jgi:HlyD family secretion protein
LQSGKAKPPDPSERTGGGDKRQTLWMPQPEEGPTPVEVKTGITDGSFTEIVAGSVKEGDPVIVGVETSKGPHGGAGGNLPPGFGPRPRGI